MRRESRLDATNPRSGCIRGPTSAAGDLRKLGLPSTRDLPSCQRDGFNIETGGMFDGHRHHHVARLKRGLGQVVEVLLDMIDVDARLMAGGRWNFNWAGHDAGAEGK